MSYIFHLVTPPPSPQVLILDIGSQYSKLIDRKVRELNIHSEIVPLTYTVEEIKKSQARYFNQKYYNEYFIIFIIFIYV